MLAPYTYCPSLGFLLAASISDGKLSLTTNGALGSTIYPLQQFVYLERGKTYDIGMLLDLTE
jgi:hypothetical protein